MSKLSNITLRDWRKFLKSQGLVLARVQGGHEMWQKEGLLRPITVQTHIDPVPERIVKQALEMLGIDRRDFKLH